MACLLVSAETTDSICCLARVHAGTRSGGVRAGRREGVHITHVFTRVAPHPFLQHMPPSVSMGVMLAVIIAVIIIVVTTVTLASSAWLPTRQLSLHTVAVLTNIWSKTDAYNMVWPSERAESKSLEQLYAGAAAVGIGSPRRMDRLQAPSPPVQPPGLATLECFAVPGPSTCKLTELTPMPLSSYHAARPMPLGPCHPCCSAQTAWPMSPCRLSPRR